MTKWVDIKASVCDGVATITFDRIERRNALSVGLLTEFTDLLDEWAADDDVAAVVLTGGEEFFCAGLDLDLQSGFTVETRTLYSETCLRAYGTLLDYRKPTIAVVGGTGRYAGATGSYVAEQQTDAAGGRGCARYTLTLIAAEDLQSGI